VLVERGAELETLESALAHAKQTGQVVLIEGPAGIGKTRLIEAVRKRAEGFEVLSARGGVLEQDIAFGVARQLLERRLTLASAQERRALLSGAAALAGRVVGLEKDDAEGTQRDLAAALHALFWLVANVAESRPVLLAVDDAHWADRASLEFLVYLAYRLEGLPILVVAAVREGEPRREEDVIGELVREATVVRPAPLSKRGIGELVGLAFGSPASHDLVEACREATGGNPFFLGELLSSLDPPGGDPSAIPLDSVRRTLPSTVAHSILLRLGRLPDPAPRLARAAALLGDGAALRHAAALAEVASEEAGPAADALVRVSILAEVHPMRFEHPIVRAAITNDVAPAERAAAHRQAAMLLRGEGEPVERIATHLLQSSPAGDEWAVESLHRAARDAMARGAPDVAARLLQRAVEEPQAKGQAELLAGLSAAQLAAGAYRESASSAQRAVDAAAEASTRSRIRLDQAYALMSVEGAPLALKCLEMGMAEASDTDPDLALLLEGELAFQASLAGVEHPVLERIRRHRGLPGVSHAERYMLGMLALQAFRDDESAETARTLALRSLGDGALLSEVGARTLAYYMATLALLFAGANEDARHAISAGMRETVKRGSAFGYAGICWMRGLLALWEGDLAAAEVDERDCVQHAVPTMVGIGVASLAMVLLEQGDIAGAYGELERGGLLSDERPLYVLGPYPRGLVRLARGDLEDALSDFEDVGRHARTVGGFAAGLPWQAGAALALHGLGRQTAAEEAAAEQLERAERRGAPMLRGIALRACGLVSSGKERLSRLADAVEVLGSTPARLELAKARFDLGVVLLRAGKRAQGRDLLQLSHDAARQCGARGLAQTTFDELKVAGARPRRLMFSGVESLTASERRVAQMAADGLSNREIAQALFVAPKTVENQLGHAYSKLGVSSRRELGRALDLPPAEAEPLET
jgi:DNA-binding CsgD family transcriptional regulator